jgi:DNA-damage-inducible protein J
MAATAVVQAKMDPALKTKAENYFEKFGIDTSTAIRIFFSKVVETGKIPFVIGVENEFLDDELAKSLDEAKENIKNNKDILRFKSNKEVFKYLDGLKK